MTMTGTDEARRGKGDHFLSFRLVFCGNGTKNSNLKIPEFPVIFMYCIAGLKRGSMGILSLQVPPKLGKFVE